MKLSKSTVLVRQGDVLFTSVGRIHSGGKKKREDGAAAYGEVTGHSHQLSSESKSCASVVEVGPELFVEVFAELDVLVGKDFVKVGSETFFSGIDFEGRVTIPSGKYSGVAFVHQEHCPVILPVGDYRITIQKEYSPESIRSVLD